MHRSWLLLLALAVTLVSVGVFANPAHSVTKAEVDRACAASQQALRQVEAAKALLDEATREYATVSAQLEDTAYQQLRARAIAEDHERDIVELRSIVQDRAVEMYMNGGLQSGDAFLFATSAETFLTGQEFLDVATKDDLALIEQLQALSGDAQRLRDELVILQDQLEIEQAEAARWQEQMDEALHLERDAYAELRGECLRVYNEYQAELARRRAAELARLSGAAAGLPPDATPGFRCPMNRPISFINDWGFHRSGGRTHKGTDIFAIYGHPVYAVANGTIRLRSGGLGGIAAFVSADYGVSFYYAHLSGYASGMRDGTRVQVGQLIGYNGDTGNARGGSPHVHFGIRTASGLWVNPYPTLVRNC